MGIHICTLASHTHSDLTEKETENEREGKSKGGWGG